MLDYRREESDNMADSKSNEIADSVIDSDEQKIDSSVSLDNRKEQLEVKINDEPDTTENDINSSEQKIDSSVSLENRKAELEKKVNGISERVSDSINDTEGQKYNSPQKFTTKMKSPYDSPPTTGSPVSKMPLPKLSADPPATGSSADVYNEYYASGGSVGYAPPYGAGHNPYRPGNPNYGVNPSTQRNIDPYAGYAAAPAKENTNTGLKSYLIIVIGITLVFIIGFVYECVRTYRADGIFGGENGLFSKDFDEYFDTDYDFGFKFNNDDDSENVDSDENDAKNGSDTDVFDFVDNGDSDEDSGEKTLKSAPSEDSVIDKNAAVIKAADQPENIDSAEYTARKAFKRVENSVVNVVVFEGAITDIENAIGTGSGIIVTEDGYIVTNSHVISDSKSMLVEIVTNTGDMYQAAIVGFDTRTDLAVLKIDGENLSAVEFVNSDQLEVGQDAIAVGNPGGMNYSNSLTRGCVSALNRTVSSNKLVPYIQTDAAINPGNSGGPLLNSAGQVMGINTIKIANSNYEGMGFAIPSNTVIKIANDLIGSGFVSNRVRLGIIGSETTGNAVGGMPEGILINEFAEDSPFKTTAAKKGDIITAIDGNKVTSFAELFSEMDDYSPGDSVKITLYRSKIIGTESNYFDVTIQLIADNGETQQ